MHAEAAQRRRWGEAVTRRRRYRGPDPIRTVRLRELEKPDVSAQVELLKAPSRVTDIDLYWAGDLDVVKSAPCVSVVGTRSVSREGAARARRLGTELGKAGVVVVSGLAKGVDTHALRAAIDAGGRVAAVIGTPLDKAYPNENSALQEEIYRDHLLVSQFPVGSKVYRTNFPKRNRVMAAISNATVIIEASDTSGTLHQASECTKLGRWLFIAQSCFEMPTLQWPRKFNEYATTIPLTSTAEIVDRITA
jgi:DNA processing protein